MSPLKRRISGVIFQAVQQEEAVKHLAKNTMVGNTCFLQSLYHGEDLHHPSSLFVLALKCIMWHCVSKNVCHLFIGVCSENSHNALLHILFEVMELDGNMLGSDFVFICVSKFLSPLLFS